MVVLQSMCSITYFHLYTFYRCKIQWFYIVVLYYYITMIEINELNKNKSRVNVGIRLDQALLIRKFVGYGKGKWPSINSFVQDAVDKSLFRVKNKK